MLKLILFIFGTPVNATLDWMEQLKSWPLKNKVIVTDTGSTKKLIMQKASELRELGITFIGGHPMAGSHKSGVLAAKAHLFEMHTICLHGSLEKKLFIWRSLKVY
ncbi:prephenate dehydrogenase/arogenate dehydrogenase family protein [Lysinibacillus irui]